MNDGVVPPGPGRTGLQIEGLPSGAKISFDTLCRLVEHIVNYSGFREMLARSTPILAREGGRLEFRGADSPAGHKSDSRT